MRELPPEVQLWIASDGPDTARLHAAYAGDPRITWLGRISDAEKIARLRGASVFCAPALGGESFGVVLLEAMAAGVPVVASDIPGYCNVARPEVDALLVPPSDPAALAVALRRVLRDEGLATSMRVAGDERAHEFSMDRLARLYLDRYEQLHHHGPAHAPTPGRRLRRMMRSPRARS